MSKNQSEVRLLSPKDILKNPHNPRLLFDEDKLVDLQESIRKNGVLVPLLVYRRGKDDKFVILDGERRWKCALRLGMEEIPANVIPEPNPLEGILRMFNIHNVRVSWELTPTALELKVVMRRLGTESEKELTLATSLSQVQIMRCKALLTYPEKYVEMSLAANKEERISGHFFAELYPALQLMQEIPEIGKKYSREYIVDQMIEKYKKKEIKTYLEFRDLTKLIRSVEKGRSREEVIGIVKDIILKPGIGIRSSFKSTAKADYDAEKVYKASKSLTKSIAKLEPSKIQSKSALVESLSELRITIEKFLRAVK